MAIQPRPTPGTTFGATLGTLGGTTSFALNDPGFAFGGCMQVATTVARNAIPVPNLQNGMLVWVEATDTYYKLRPTWPGGILSVDGDWEVAIGPGAGVNGSGTAQQVTVWTGASTIGGSSDFTRPTATGLVNNNQGFSTNFNVNVERWVSTTGSDSNDGATSLTPWLTLEHALEQCPKLGSGRYLIHVANGTYANTAFTIPAFAGNLDFGEGFENYIYIQGNSGSPSSVVFQNTAAIMCYHNQPNVYLAIEGVRFEGDPAQAGIQQTSGTTRLINCQMDNYETFAQVSNSAEMILDGTITATDTSRIIYNYFGYTELNADITQTPPNPLTLTPFVVYSYGGVVTHRSGNVTMTCPALAAQGGLFYFDSTQYLFGSSSTFTINDGDSFMYCENSIGRSGNGNGIYVNAGNALFSLIGNSNFIDGSGTLWRSDSSGALVIPMTTGARFTSANFAETGTLPGPFIVRNDIVTYARYDNPANYYACADDNRYVDVTTFTCLGVLPQGGTTMLIGPAGISTAEQYIKIVERPEQLLGIRVYTGVPNGAAHTDTYYAYVNAASSGLSVSLTNTNTNSATAASIIPLSAGDRISVRCTSDAATAAENITVAILTRKRL